MKNVWQILDNVAYYNTRGFDSFGIFFYNDRLVLCVDFIKK